MKNNLIKYLLYLLVIDLLIITKNAYAYLDPGTITAFIQLLIAGVAGALITIKFWWLSFKNFIINIFKSKKSDNDKKNENS